MANPVGEDSWIAYADESSRHATDLERRVGVVELFKRAVTEEPGSLKVWLAYCEWFWSLHLDCQNDDAGWPAEEQALGRELFSLDAALELWARGYDAVRYRLADSSRLWNRWIGIELEQLAAQQALSKQSGGSGVPEAGVRRITHLFRDRLQTPHAGWDDTSQMFSSFLSEYNRAAWEDTMQEVTALAQEAKRLYEPRDPFEMRLAKAAREDPPDAPEGQRAVLREYLDWEVIQSKKNTRKPETSVRLCLGLWDRALTGVLAFDDATWTDYVVYLSTWYTQIAAEQEPQQQGGGARQKGKQLAATPQVASRVSPLLPSLLDVLRRAVAHCPWSGTLWARYILAAEEAGLPFADIEQIKHSATSNGQLDRDGMTGVLEMYAAWCGYLKRSAMADASASRAGAASDNYDESVDLADVGLPAALEDVQLWGERLLKDAYQGDPAFRLERILIQYLTEKKGAIEEARERWNRMAEKPLYIDSYDFWLHYYKWEMMVFSWSSGLAQGQALAGGVRGTSTAARTPTLATEVLVRAVNRKTMDWPERILEVFLHHTNEYEAPKSLRHAMDTGHRIRKGIAKRREREAAEQAAAYAAQQELYAQQQAAARETLDHAETASNGKRKRESGAAEADTDEGTESAAKRARSGTGGGLDGLDAVSAAQQAGRHQQEAPARDREHTSVLVSNLPHDITQTKLKHYFREYGHINNLIVSADPLSKRTPQPCVALIEFRTAEEAQSALLRDRKYLGDSQISVEDGSGLTLFVTNYPPSADESYIRGLLGGDDDEDMILSVRLPSLRFNAARRFCYVSFRSREAADAAVRRCKGKILMDETDGKTYRLEVAHSDPSARGRRSGATAEGRECHVTGLDRTAGEDDVRAVFEKYGAVESVRVLRNAMGRSKGSAFVAFARPEDAAAAVEGLDKTRFRGAILAVEIAREKAFRPVARSGGAAAPPSEGQAASPASKDGDNDGDSQMADVTAAAAEANKPSASEVAARTVSVLGIPETMNDARVRLLLTSLLDEETSNKLLRLTLRPDRGGCILEFADASAAGRAAMAVDQREVEVGEGKKTVTLRTGSKADLFAASTAPAANGNPPATTKSQPSAAKPSAVTLMPPPSLISRPRPTAGFGVGKPRRGLGFTSAISAAKKTGDNANGGDAAGPPASASTVPKKTNADFKAMFLGGGTASKSNGDPAEEARDE